MTFALMAVALLLGLGTAVLVLHVVLVLLRHEQEDFDRVTLAWRNDYERDRRDDEA